MKLFQKFGSSRKQKQKALEVEALTFRVLMDCLNQQNLKKLKEAVSLSVYKRNPFSYIIDKISGQLPPVKIGVWVKFRVSFRVGRQPDNCPGEKLPSG